MREAVEMFVESVTKVPLLWSSWLELALLVTDKEMVVSVKVNFIIVLLLILRM